MKETGRRGGSGTSLCDMSARKASKQAQIAGADTMTLNMDLCRSSVQGGLLAHADIFRAFCLPCWEQNRTSPMPSLETSRVFLPTTLPLSVIVCVIRRPGWKLHCFARTPYLPPLLSWLHGHHLPPASWSLFYQSPSTQVRPLGALVRTEQDGSTVRFVAEDA